MKIFLKKPLLILVAVISIQGECYASVVDAGWQYFSFGSLADIPHPSQDKNDLNYT